MMTRSFMLLFALLLGNASDGREVAMTGEPFETMYYQYGYKSIDRELRTCEKLFRKTIHLPVNIPPLPFTHQFARCSWGKGDNDHLEIEYINRHQGGSHYLIRISPLEHKITNIPSRQSTIRKYRLKDGSRAVYGSIGGTGSFRILVFEKKGLQYILSMNRRMSHIVTGDVLVDIANSVLEYESVEEVKDLS
ncbi:hypothetical protein [Paenibacillus sp. MSJ-34]|uniref:hypothetical protein n=1 Tax=Paenibacillus sp. MSJ-34 TaxID=2841529 RepID=UPI001C106D68|nr:hypothetical protein [Paenibacillus sp. MSJ-34]MBU5442255.1 hypothetical protein [Paenibacillus sp. MSJ-34]